jgi:hypothetical protein
MNRNISASVLLLLLTASAALAASQPPLEPGVITQVQSATRSFIDTQTVDGVYLYYDSATSAVRRLEFKMLHPVVDQEGDIYVARADFFDQQGRPVNMKFFVVMHGRQPHTLQAVAHGNGEGVRLPCTDSSS